MGGDVKAKVAGRRCPNCGGVISAGEGYRHQGRAYCLDCYTDLRARPMRKTHWQYISTRAQYLREP